jgi:NADH-quinone oxidoreductase subunit M
MISLLTFLPLAFAVAILVSPSRRPEVARLWALAGSLLIFFLAVRLLWLFEAEKGLQFIELYTWVPSLGIDYFVGVDGLSVTMLFFTALLFPLVVLASPMHEKSKTYFALLALQFTGIFGAFTALNFFHWFLFWELCLVPAFFLIKLFGEDGRHDAALSFFLYTVLGSVAMLVGFIALYFAADTFNFVILSRKAAALPGLLGPAYPWVFLAILAGLWVKVPLVPLHIWQPEAYTRAPIPVAMVLTGLMSKMGVYAILRIIWPLFPQALLAVRDALLAICLLTILLGAYAALRQNDLKKMLAYSSLNHVAYCIFAALAVCGVAQGGMALQGAILQMLTHGVTAAALFFLVGIIESRAGTRSLSRLGGLRGPMPVFATALSLFAFSSLGLPFLAGFVSEFLIFAGAFQSAAIYVVLALPALLTTAIFLLNMLQKTLTGPAPEKPLADLSRAELFILAPLVALTFWIGLAPGFWVRLAEFAVRHNFTYF